MRHQTKVRKEAHLRYQEFNPMDRMRLHTTPSPEATSKQPTERTAGRKDAGPANDKGAGGWNMGVRGYGKHGIWKKESSDYQSALC